MKKSTSPRLSKLAFQGIADAVIGADARDRILFMNPAAERLTGWSEKEALGRGLSKIYKTAVEETERQACPSILHSRDGSEHPIEEARTTLRDSRGAPIGQVLIFRDVGERLQAELKCKQSEELKAAVINTALDGIIIMNHRGLIVEFNPAAERIFGYRKADVLGAPMAEKIIPPSMRMRHHRGLARYLSTGEGPVLNQRIELTAKRSDGTEFPVELAITCVPGEQPPLFTGYLRDISDRKLEERAKEIELHVAGATGQARTLGEAIRACLEQICRIESWSLGQVWMMDSERQVLVCTEHFHAAVAGMDEFRRVSLGTVFQAGTGVPGRVWQSQSAEWIADFPRAGLPRSVASAQAGLSTAVAFPIRLGRKPAAVIEFLSTDRRQPNPFLLKALDRLSVVLSNILERKRAEDQVRQAEEQLRLVIDTVPALISYIDQNQRYVFTNRGYEQWFGLSPSETQGLHLKDLLGDTVYQITLPHIERALRGEKVTYEALMPFEGHGPKWVDVTYTPHYGAFGRVEGIVVLVTDLTARKRSEQAQHFLSEATKCLSSSLDNERNLQQVARLAVPTVADACEVYLLDGETFRRTASSPPEASLDPLKRSAAESEPRFHETDFSVPLGDGAGAIRLVMIEPGRRFEPRDLDLAKELARRVTMVIENARLYRQAKEAVRARDEFLSIASHELRTPLTSQQLQLQGILRQVTKGDPQALAPDRMQRTLEIIKRQGDRLTHLIGNLLDLSRINIGRFTLEMADVDLGDVARSVLERLREEIRRSGSSVAIDIGPEVTGRWDPMRIDQIIENLVTNALKYGEGKPIELRIEAETSSVKIVVRDRGIGIDSADQARLFRPFERAASAKQYGGLGMGLYIVRQIVEAHGGSVALKSAPGSGSTFTVNLPRRPPE